MLNHPFAYIYMGKAQRVPEFQNQYVGGLGANATELLDIITEYAPLLEVWNTEMREFFAQERKENAVFVTL